MVIIITLPEYFEGEAEQITRFLLEGKADIIHLRKPSSSAEELEALIRDIPQEWRDRLVVHDYHHLAEKYNLRGIHLNSRNPDIPQGFRYSTKQRGYIIKGGCMLSVSRSCHSFQELAEWKDRCCYVSLSPIYDSISKKGYCSAFTKEELKNAHECGIIDCSVVALGGITFDKLAEIDELGFGGAMILGDAWKRRKRSVLTIAGSDSGGGAGIQGDIKTISACGCYATSAITAVTVQNTLGVSSVFPIPADVVRQQIEAVLSDIGADAIKIGMITSSEIMSCIAEEINAFGIKNVVCDTVMVSTSGHRLMEEEAIDTFIKSLIPNVRVITPNIPEAKILLQRYRNCTECSISNKEDMMQAAKELANYSGVSVLLKGGHLEDDNLVDIFYNNEEHEVIELPSLRIATCNTHGTGCTLSSAFASMLAKGYSLSHSAREAKEYINNAIASGAQYKIGNGIGPLDHFWK